MNKQRVHYMPDCENVSGNDTLAVTTEEAIERVNCSVCIREMTEHGLFGDEK